MQLDVLIYSLQITVIGMGVVFLALSVVSIVISLFDRIGREAAAPSPVHQEVAPAIEATESDVILPEVVAVISAAVAVALGQQAHVVHIRHSTVSGSWQQSGRATIMASHVIKR